MKEIEFTIDTKTGELTSTIHGIPGPSCGDIAKIIQELAGVPAVDEKTPEYFHSIQPQQQVQR